ncbi:MAG: hypothetical protein J6X55_07010 [Victivallales bacterium]|nr:hypothetical protein [Victivallales bacterium]
MSEEPKKERMKLTCPGCQSHLDVTDLEPFSVFACPQCGMQVKVPKWWQQYLLEDCLANQAGIEKYRALDAALDREVIIEMVTSAGGYTPVEMDNYLEVIRRVAAVTDPALGIVYSCGKYDDGVYSVQQYLPEGFSVADSEPQEWKDVREWLINVLRVLQKTSDLSILHGRINLSCFRKSDSHTNRLAGFGIGMALSEHIPFDSYTSPERIGGAPASLQGDIYSLGKVLWHCLAGRLPEEGGVLGSNVPEEIGKLLRRMISVSPLDRPSSYDEILKIVESATGENSGSQKKKMSIRGVGGQEQNKGGVHLVGVGANSSVRNQGASTPLPPPPAASGGNMLLNILLVLALLTLIGILSFLLLTYGDKEEESPEETNGTIVQTDGGTSSNIATTDKKDEPEEENFQGTEGPGYFSSQEEDTDEDDDEDGPEVVETEKPIKEITHEEVAKKKLKPLSDELRKKRPHPKNPMVMRSRRVRNFIEKLPPEYKESVEIQANYLNNLPTIVMFYARKLKYDRGPNTILRLRKGNRKIKGYIAMANDKGMMVRSLDKSQKNVPDTVKFSDLSRRTIMDMLDYYCDFSYSRLNPHDREYNIQMQALVKHYVALLLLADWYDEQDAARKYAKRCIKLHPKSEPFLAKFGYGKNKK